MFIAGTRRSSLSWCSCARCTAAKCPKGQSLILIKCFNARIGEQFTPFDWWWFIWIVNRDEGNDTGAQHGSFRPLALSAGQYKSRGHFTLPSGQSNLIPSNESSRTRHHQCFWSSIHVRWEATKVFEWQRRSDESLIAIGVACLLYDHALTFESERQAIWANSDVTVLSKFGFFTNRYGSEILLLYLASGMSSAMYVGSDQNVYPDSVLSATRELDISVS